MLVSFSTFPLLVHPTRTYTDSILFDKLGRDFYPNIRFVLITVIILFLLRQHADFTSTSSVHHCNVCCFCWHWFFFSSNQLTLLVFAISGATCGTLCTYVLPAYFYYKVTVENGTWKRRLARLGSLGLMVVGVVMMVVCVLVI